MSTAQDIVEDGVTTVTCISTTTTRWRKHVEEFTNESCSLGQGAPLVHQSDSLPPPTPAAAPPLVSNSALASVAEGDAVLVEVLVQVQVLVLVKVKVKVQVQVMVLVQVEGRYLSKIKMHD